MMYYSIEKERTYPVDLPVSIATKRLPHASKDVKVYYPVVTQLPNPNAQSTINHAIITTLNKILVEQSFYDERPCGITCQFRVKEQSTWYP